MEDGPRRYSLTRGTEMLAGAKGRDRPQSMAAGGSTTRYLQQRTYCFLQVLKRGNKHGYGTTYNGRGMTTG